MSTSENNGKKNNAKVPVPRVVTVFMLLALLIIGLVSTTFASFVPQNADGEDGSLIAQVKSAVVNRSKDDLADTKANVDVADIGATITSDGSARLYFNMKAVSWWTAGNGGDGNFAYFFNNSTGTNAWSAHAVQYSGDTYYVVIPSGSWAGVILTRNNTSTSPTWDNKWNQTGDITMSSSSNYISKFSEGSGSVTWGSAVKIASTASLAASKTNVETNTAVTLTPSLSSNASLNSISGTTYSISPSTGASISGNTFTATEAGTYTVTATVTYHPKGYSGITSTATASKTITVTRPGFTYTATAGTGGKVSATPASPATSVTVTATPNTGYQFYKWVVNANATQTSTSTNSSTGVATGKFTITANGATIQATFKKRTYTVTLNANGGTINAGNVSSYTYGTAVTLPTNVTKTGYTFTGWKNDSTGSIEKTIPATATGNKSYTAQYTLNTYTITYIDGSTTLEGLTPTTYNYETTATLPTNITKVGYTFVGWYKNSSFTGSAVTQIVKNTTTGNQTFYAKWQESNFDLTVVDIDGNSIADKVKVVANGSTTITETSGKYKIPNLSKVEVSVTAPQGYYAKIQDSDGNYLDSNELTYTTSTGNNPLTTVKFVLDSVTADAQYYVEFCKNPTIKVVQPKYGSIYITSGSDTSTKYYMNGESVYAGTTLTVHTMIDNDKNVVIDGNRKTEFNSCTISSVKYTPEGGSAVSLKNQETNTFKITANTTVTAEITMNAFYAFDEDTEKTEYGKRRIFFTDNANWDKDSKDAVSVHYSDVEEDTTDENFDITANSIVMTYKYENEANQGVYYADIPFSAKYVVFYNNVKTEDDKYEKTKVGTITNDSNAFWKKDDGTLEPWHCEYSDYIATDRATTAQQGIVPINNTITFEYSCNYGDDTLSAEVVSGNTANVEFNSGYLNITPTSNTYDYSLVKVTSKSSKTSKYYLVKLSKITAVVNEMQKIFPEINSVGLSGSFSSSSVLTSLQYYVLYNNFPGEEEKDYVQIGDIKIPADKLSCSYDVIAKAGTNGEKYSGVRFFKITAKDSTNATLDVVHKTAFGTDSTSSTGRSVYLLNTTGVSMSKYNVRACFESSDGESWVTMQQLEGTDYYRASVPDGYEYTVSFYLTHKDRYANIKSNEEGFNYICYFYNEDIRIPNDINVNPVYQIKEFNSTDRTMKLVLKE